METQKVKCIGRYSNMHQILLVGEGDFSFSLCLAKAFGSATNMTATSRDTREELERKYADGKQNVEELKRLGCNVVHEVNVHTMSSDCRLTRHKYDTIVFNFPHAGFHFGREHESKTIKKHQKVVRGFMRNARWMVKARKGEVHVTHKTAYPFSEWNITTLACENGLRYYGEVKFQMCQFPGYSNKRGSGNDCDVSFPVGESSIFIFRKSKAKKKIKK